MQANVFAVWRIHILSRFPLQLFDENKIPRRNLVFLIQKMMLHSILFTQILKVIICYLINNALLIDSFVHFRLCLIYEIKIMTS